MYSMYINVCLDLLKVRGGEKKVEESVVLWFGLEQKLLSEIK